MILRGKRSCPCALDEFFSALARGRALATVPRGTCPWPERLSPPLPDGVCYRGSHSRALARPSGSSQGAIASPSRKSPSGVAPGRGLAPLDDNCERGPELQSPRESVHGLLSRKGWRERHTASTYADGATVVGSSGASKSSRCAVRKIGRRPTEVGWSDDSLLAVVWGGPRAALCVEPVVETVSTSA